jgi:hypothetical protein
MKIRVTLDITKAVRRRLRHRDGKSGLATRQEMLREFWDAWEDRMVKICEDGAPDVTEEIEEGEDD